MIGNTNFGTEIKKFYNIWRPFLLAGLRTATTNYYRFDIVAVHLSFVSGKNPLKYDVPMLRFILYGAHKT